MSDELKPCPFCGREPQRRSRPSDVNKSGVAHIIRCFCGGYSARAHIHAETEEKALAEWNTRAVPDLHPLRELAENSKPLPADIAKAVQENWDELFGGEPDESLADHANHLQQELGYEREDNKRVIRQLEMSNDVLNECALRIAALESKLAGLLGDLESLSTIPLLTGHQLWKVIKRHQDPMTHKTDSNPGCCNIKGES